MGKNGLNKVMLIGNIGRDPEQKFLQNGRSFFTLKFSYASERVQPYLDRVI